MRGRHAHNKRRVGIRWRLFGALALFTAVILLVLWLFQVRLLGTFYEREKFSELRDAVGVLEKYLDRENAEERVAEYARENGICVRIFSVDGTYVRLIADADVTSSCVIHHLPAEALGNMYDMACENGGVYEKRLEFKEDLLTEQEGRFPGFPLRGTTVNAIYVKVLPGAEVDHVMLLDSEMTPVEATVRTLEKQFVWIACVLLGASFLFALLLSHIVAKPLIRITKKAERLSAGEFEISFEREEGYREVQELADTLTFAAGEIGAAGRLQRELVANISHDLRTPLTMIKGYGEMMRDIPGENSPENIQAVIDETTRLSELVSDLLDLSKLQAGNLEPHEEVFDLTQTLRDALARYDTLIRHQGYRIDTVIDVGEVLVRADRTMILQVLYNLVGNAVNYTGAQKRVLVTETVNGGTVCISVADDGDGIPPEQIGEIWDRYYRVDREHRRAVMGTGLGLSIVKNVMEAHKAAYGVESAVGTGSVFWFKLPVVERDEP